MPVTNREELEIEADEDEEILQLKLQALEAKLKLKRLQQKRSNDIVSSTTGICRNSALDSARKENVPPSSRRRNQLEASKNVQIPVSPQRKRSSAPEARSPGRVLLGIDKGLKGRNISLRRPMKPQERDEDPFVSSVPPSSTSKKDLNTNTANSWNPSGKSFSEKIAESRQHDKSQRENQLKRYAQRNTGFGVTPKEIDALKADADGTDANIKQRTKPRASAEGNGFSRDQVLQAMSHPDPGFVRRSNSTAGSLEQGDSSLDTWKNPNAEPDPAVLVRTASNTSKRRVQSLSPPPKVSTDTDKESNRSQPLSDSLFEPFSTTHLSKRLLPHDLLTRTFTDKTILRIPDLLVTVKSPEYALPDDLEADYVVLGVIGSKSPPLSHKDHLTTTSSENATSLTEATSSAQNAKGKFMILTLTDLKWTLDLYLFTTAYTRFWKLVPGTVVALLNPNIMPPPPHKADTGRFSLTLNSSEDTILEIGTSRDLGWCKAVRKDGKQCPDWVDKRHTEYCEFHVDRVVERTRRGRMEVQGMSAPFAPGGRKQDRTGFFGRGGGSGTGSRSRQSEKMEYMNDGFRKEGPQYNRLTSSKLFITPGIPRQSAARLLDAEGMMTMRGESKEERVRKRLAEREREEEIARKLGEGGNGAGSEYLRLRQVDGNEAHSQASGDVGQQSREAVDAGSLGLLGNKAKEVHLSPIKYLKRKAILSGETPAMKKTRFVTERGIKEAGRESLSGLGQALRDEDEDELEIESS